MEGNDADFLKHMFNHDLENKILISDGFVYEGMIHLERDTKITMKDLYFLNNHAYHRAMIYVKE